jgi:sorting nexin-25
MASPKLEIGRKPLFDDADEEPEEAEGEKELDFVQVQTIEAIQDALNSILETDAKGLARGSNSAKSTASLNNLSASPKPVGGGRRVVSASPKGTAARTRTQQLATRPRPASPSSSRPNAVGMPLPRRPLFDDDVDIAAPDDASAHSSDIDSEIETAARPPLPIVSMIGDLELQKELDKYEARTETLRGQEDVLEALVRKAELTGNARELKLLAKSRAALHRELRGIDYQRAQLEAQAAEHRLVPGRVAITISGTTIGEAHGKSFVLYLVEVHQLEEEGGQPVSGWFVTRRYSEFDQLDRALRDKLPHFRAPELPSKHLVTALSGSMVELRRAGLERYLKVRSLSALSIGALDL